MKKRYNTYGKNAINVRSVQPSKQDHKIRWGLFAITIGCIMIMYAQTYSDIAQKLRDCISGGVIAVFGIWLVYREKKKYNHQ